MSASDEACQVVSRAVNFYERRIISLALLWQQLADALNLPDVWPVLGSLPAAQQETLRNAYKERPLSLRSEGRDSQVRQEMERWCRAPLTTALPVNPTVAPVVQQERPAPLGVRAKRVEPPRSEQPWQELLALYREYGYVRRPRFRPGNDEDWEVRFVFHYAWEAKPVQRLLDRVGFPGARVFRRYGYSLLCLPGRRAVERILGLVDGSRPLPEHSG
jgi:hypothetical protein